MRLIAGAEQHDVNSWLVAHVAVRCIGDRVGAARMHQEAERIVALAQVRRHLPRRRQLAHRSGQVRGAHEDAAHREHHQRADTVGARGQEDTLARHLVHHVERDHRRVPLRITRGAIQHVLVDIVPAPSR